MDEESDVKIVDVSEPKRGSDEFEDGVCKKASTDLFLKFTRYARTKYSGSTPTHLITQCA